MGFHPPPFQQPALSWDGETGPELGESVGKRVWLGRSRKGGACKGANDVGPVGYEDAEGVRPSQYFRVLAQPWGKVAR